MKKILVLSLLLFSQICFAEGVFDYEIFMSKVPEEEVALAKFFDSKIDLNAKTKAKSVSTTSFQKYVNAFGYWHVGIYGNGCVATCYDGVSIGRQEIYTNGILYSVSLIFANTGNSVTHYHDFCSVITTPTKQTILYK